MTDHRIACQADLERRMARQREKMMRGVSDVGDIGSAVGRISWVNPELAAKFERRRLLEAREAPRSGRLPGRASGAAANNLPKTSALGRPAWSTEDVPQAGPGRTPPLSDLRRGRLVPRRGSGPRSAVNSACAGPLLADVQTGWLASAWPGCQPAPLRSIERRPNRWVKNYLSLPWHIRGHSPRNSPWPCVVPDIVLAHVCR